MDITLALGGGGAKGNAHVGVLRQLEKEGFRVRAVAGTSFGGIVAAMYAAGYTPDEIEDNFVSVDQTRLFSYFSEPYPSLLGLGGVRKWLDDAIGERTFADLKIPCALTAVDLNCGCEVVLQEGLVKDAVLATIAIPGVFPAFHTQEWELVDGGVLNPVPVSVARMLKPNLPIVAVTLQAPLGEPARSVAAAMPLHVPGGLTKPILDRLSNLRVTQAMDIFMRSVDVGNRAVAEFRLLVDKPDVIIRPDVADIPLLGQVDVHKVVKRGEAAVKDAITELRQSVSWTKRLKRSLFGNDHDA
ncbi:MAG: patatin-like phospholipase family protein [Anaerolineales bacterium]